jgi:hypothetical protein
MRNCLVLKAEESLVTIEILQALNNSRNPTMNVLNIFSDPLIANESPELIHQTCPSLSIVSLFNPHLQLFPPFQPLSHMILRAIHNPDPFESHNK